MSASTVASTFDRESIRERQERILTKELIIDMLTLVNDRDDSEGEFDEQAAECSQQECLLPQSTKSQSSTSRRS